MENNNNKRLLSLDVFRGFDMMFIMGVEGIIVTLCIPRNGFDNPRVCSVHGRIGLDFISSSRPLRHDLIKSSLRHNHLQHSILGIGSSHLNFVALAMSKVIILSLSPDLAT